MVRLGNMRQILLLVAILTALSGCGWRRPASVRIDPALATLMPRDTLLLAGIRVEALRATPLYKKIGAEAISGLVSGLDLKNIWEILAASNGGEMAILARGKFASAGMEPEISLPGASRTAYRLHAPRKRWDRSGFFESEHRLAGRPKSVKSILGTTRKFERDPRGRSRARSPRSVRTTRSGLWVSEVRDNWRAPCRKAGISEISRRP